MRRRQPWPYPAVALVVAAYNEEDFILEKIQNTLALDYPKDKLELIFITDGSNDNTPAIISPVSGILLLHQPARQGKVAAMNRAIQQVQSPWSSFVMPIPCSIQACVTGDR